MLGRERAEALVLMAMEEAAAALARGDDPYGGVIADREGRVLVRDGNRENTERNPCAHAEMVLIREACAKLGRNDLSDCLLVCNYRPCPMCAAAMVQAGIREIYIGSAALDFPALLMKTAGSYAEMGITVTGGILDEACAAQVRAGREQRAKEREAGTGKESGSGAPCRAGSLEAPADGR